MGQSSWRETRSRFPRDQQLRDFGWIIHGRPRDGPAIWWRGPHDKQLPIPFEEAVELVKAKIRELDHTCTALAE
jgi:hypothetical protein